MKKQSNPTETGKSGTKTSAKLRLFVWTHFSPDYTGGLAFAIAKDEADARRQILKKCGTVDDWGHLEIRPLTKRFCESVSGGS